jgi:hypothetical protein
MSEPTDAECVTLYRWLRDRSQFHADFPDRGSHHPGMGIKVVYFLAGPDAGRGSHHAMLHGEVLDNSIRNAIKEPSNA